VAAEAAPVRKRPRPGERRVQILQTLAACWNNPGPNASPRPHWRPGWKSAKPRCTGTSPARRRCSKGLIEFIETTVFTLINQVVPSAKPSLAASPEVCVLLLQFGEKNPGMTRVMVGDALVFEHERLIARMNQFFDRVESQLRQCLRAAAEAAGSPTPTVDAQALASATTALLVGRLQRYARSGFKRLPTEHLEPALQRLTS
jgi:TetR/AcrR family transcriptional regulator